MLTKLQDFPTEYSPTTSLAASSELEAFHLAVGIDAAHLSSMDTLGCYILLTGIGHSSGMCMEQAIEGGSRWALHLDANARRSSVSYGSMRKPTVGQLTEGEADLVRHSVNPSSSLPIIGLGHLLVPYLPEPT